MANATKWILAWCLFVIGLGGSIAAASDISGRVDVQGDHGMIDVAFNDHDRFLIREYYGYAPTQKQVPPGLAKKGGLPPGLAKKGKLPPGIQRQLVRRGQLPPETRYQYLPRDLDRRLSRLPEDYARVMVGGSFVLFHERTRVIFDIFQDFD